MTEPIIIQGESEAEIDQQLVAYFNQHQNAFDHTLQLHQAAQTVLLEVDIDPGGGFESGYATTRFSAPVVLQQAFQFTIHPEGFLADLGKLLGLQDEVIGYPGFDEKMIIKTDNKEKVQAVFSNAAARQTLTTLDKFNLQLKSLDAENTPHVLVLKMEEGIVEADELMKLYRVFYGLLTSLQTI